MSVNVRNFIVTLHEMNIEQLSNNQEGIEKIQHLVKLVKTQKERDELAIYLSQHNETSEKFGLLCKKLNSIYENLNSIQ